MSLILDALNRADQERSEENHTPNLHAGHEVTSAATNPIRRWIIEAIIILLAAAAFIYSQWFIEPSNTVVKAPVLEKNPAQSVIIEPTISLNSKVTATVSQATSDETTPSKLMAASSKKDLVKKAIKDASIASLYEKQPIQPPTTATTTNADIQSTRTLPQATNEADNTLEILQQIPLITDLSSRFQRSIPSIDYSIHVYSEEDASGFVKLNGSIQRIGSQVLTDLRVIAILKESVVLDYKGTQFRLTSLNSWVNYQ
jgi:general secretion pathway protein B